MDSIADLLPNSAPNEPPQVEMLKNYIQQKFNSKSKVSVSSTGYSVTVPNAPLATALRMDMPNVIKSCSLDKKLFIRIGHFE